MKKIFTIALVFIATSLISQEFTYKKVSSSFGTVKMKGTLKITDTIIHMTGKGFNFSMKVKKTLDANGYKQFKSINPDGSLNENTRWSLSYSDLKKTREWMFITEMKDDFSGSYQVTTYFLIPKEEE
tara:strand:+ start:47025 stop:47405 length:381 start_codon:yes stop_codon:yes gene_type:complete